MQCEALLGDSISDDGGSKRSIQCSYPMDERHAKAEFMEGSKKKGPINFVENFFCIQQDNNGFMFLFL